MPKQNPSPEAQNATYRAFVRWKTIPLTQNDPQSLEAFCELHSVSKETILEFVQKPEYGDDILISTLSWAKSKTPELMHTIYREVKNNKSVSDLQKFLELAHDLEKKQNSKSNTQNNFFINLPDDQYKNIVTREAKLLKA